MLKALWQKLDDFEDDPIAPVIGVAILISFLLAILLVPVADTAVIQ